MRFICARCDATFDARGDRPAIYCSLRCRQNKETSECPVCGTAFTRKASQAGTFCSRACSDIGQTRRIGSDEKKIQRTCPGCGVVFTTLTYREAKYCSTKCRHDSATDSRECPGCHRQFTFWKSWPRIYCSNVCAGTANVANITTFAPSRFTATCEQCEGEFTTTPKRTRGRFCGRKCWADWLRENAPTGEDAPNWRGGPYYGGSWKRAKRAARNRDKQCMDCGITPEELGRSLDVHHIIGFRNFGREHHIEANDLDNLICLCPMCHQIREWAPGGGKWTDQRDQMLRIRAELDLV